MCPVFLCVQSRWANAADHAIRVRAHDREIATHTEHNVYIVCVCGIVCVCVWGGMLDWVSVRDRFPPPKMSE